MIINDNWKIEDAISGLLIEVNAGKNLDKLHIESLDKTMNRDFWFTKDGEFDGTGSAIYSKKGGGKYEQIETKR